jgi:hypothetical protein
LKVVPDAVGPGPTGAHDVVRAVLATNPSGPEALAEARHRCGMENDAERASAYAARAGRETEQALALARRETDPRDERHLRWWAGGAVVALLCAGAGAVAFVLADGLSGPERLVLAAAVTVAAGGWAWMMALCRRSDRPVGVLAALGVSLFALLGGLHMCETDLSLATELETVGLVALGCAFVTVATWVLLRTEAWRLGPLRRAAGAAERASRLASSRLAEAEARAERALGAWQGLVLEECRLVPPAPGTDPGTLAAECSALATQLVDDADASA